MKLERQVGSGLWMSKDKCPDGDVVLGVRGRQDRPPPPPRPRTAVT